MTDAVLYELNDRIATITLNRPETRNALSDDVVPALIAQLERAEADSQVSCIILTGAGTSFSSGGNLKEIRAMTQEKKLSVHGIRNWYLDCIQQIPRAMAKLTVPVICAVNGHAIGAGCDLTMMCDIRIASEKAVFAESFMRVGLIPGDGGAWLLPRAIGRSRAAEMAYTGRTIDAAKALGLVIEVAGRPIGRDVRRLQIGLAVFDDDVGILQLNTVFPNRFHFTAKKLKPRLQRVDHSVVNPRLTFLGHEFHGLPRTGFS